MFTVSAISLLLRVADEDQRGRATGVWQSGFLLGAIAGPAIGGPLTDISLRAPFFVYAVTLAAAGSIALVFLSRADLHDAVDPDKQPPPSLRLPEALRVSGYRAALTSNLGSGWATFGVRSSLIPLFVTEGLGASGTWTGIGFFVSAAAQGALLLVAGGIADRRGRRPSMIAGGSFAAVAMLMVAVSESLPVYVVAMALFGAGAAFLSVAPSAAVGDVVSGRGGTVIAAFQMSSDLGAVAGPLVAGWLSDTYSFGAAFGVTAGVLAAGVLSAVLSTETRHRAHDAADAEPAAGATG
jgi:MFS family permease